MDLSWQWCHHIGWTDRGNSLKTDARANAIWTSSYRDFLILDWVKLTIETKACDPFPRTNESGSTHDCKVQDPRDLCHGYDIYESKSQFAECSEKQNLQYIFSFYSISTSRVPSYRVLWRYAVCICHTWVDRHLWLSWPISGSTGIYRWARVWSIWVLIPNHWVSLM